jgi:hypothetical protein
VFLSKIEQHNEERRRAADEDERQGQADADLGKAYRDAYAPPASYPLPFRVSPEDFRRGPVREGHGALSPGHEPPLSFPGRPAGSSADGDCP